jgi:hypothetical protein
MEPLLKEKSSRPSDAMTKSEYEIIRDTRVAQMAARLKPIELALQRL